MPTGRPPHGGPQNSGSPQRDPLHSGRRPHRHYWWALLAVPVLIAAALYGAGGMGSTPAPSQGHTTAASPGRASTEQGSVTDVQTAAPCASLAPTPEAPCSVGGARLAKMPAGSATSGAARTTSLAGRSGPAAAAGSSAPSKAAASAAASPAAPANAAPSQQGAPADQVLTLINQARAQAGLPALTFSAGLDQSASGHNSLMAGGCGLTHQCPGEPPIGTRETDAGVHWTAAGENIGEEGPVADTTADIAAAAVGLTQAMLNEKPPDDGHRVNILSTSYAHIGIAVYRGSDGTVWMTQDFSS